MPGATVKILRSGELQPNGAIDSISQLYLLDTAQFVDNGPGNYSLTYTGTTAGSLTLEGGTISTSGGAELVLPAGNANTSIFAYWGSTAYINGAINLNNSPQTFQVCDGPNTYAVVEGSTGQFVAGGPLGQYTYTTANSGTNDSFDQLAVIKLGGDNTLLTKNDEVQELYLSNSVTSFTLTYTGTGQVSGTISTVGSSAANLAQAIQGQMNTWFGTGNVIVSDTTAGTGTAANNLQSVFYLTFVGQDAGTSVAPVQLGTITGASYSEVCKIAFPYQPFAGSWTITLDGQTTTTLAPSATPTQVATRLERLDQRPERRQRRGHRGHYRQRLHLHDHF